MRGLIPTGANRQLHSSWTPCAFDKLRDTKIPMSTIIFWVCRVGHKLNLQPHHDPLCTTSSIVFSPPFFMVQCWRKWKQILGSASSTNQHSSTYRLKPCFAMLNTVVNVSWIHILIHICTKIEFFQGAGHMPPPCLVQISVVVFAESWQQSNRHRWKHNLLGRAKEAAA